MTILTFKWKNRNQILIELKKEETEHFCVKLYGLIVNSCSLEEECTFDTGRSQNPNFPRISCSVLLKEAFWKISYILQAVRSSFAILFQTSHLVYLFSETSSTGCILLCGTVSAWTTLLPSLIKTFLSSCVTFIQAAAFSRHSTYKTHIMKNSCFIYNQFAIEAIEQCINITDGSHWFVRVYFCKYLPTHIFQWIIPLPELAK